VAARRRGRRCLPAGDPSSSTISSVTAAARAMPPSFSGEGEEHSRGVALRRAARGGAGLGVGVTHVHRSPAGRAGVRESHWRNEARFGREAWSRALAQVRVCCARGGGGRSSLASSRS